MRKKARKLLTVCFVTALMVLCLGSTAFAKTRKVKPVSRSYISSTKKVEKRAAKVKKGSQTIVMPSSGSAYLKFVAGKTGDYYFTISNIKKKKGHSSARGTFSFEKTQKDDYKYLRYVSAVTYGGRNVSLNFSTSEMKPGVLKAAWYLPKRTGRIHLQKGEVVYIYVESTAKSFNLKVK